MSSNLKSEIKKRVLSRKLGFYSKLLLLAQKPLTLEVVENGGSYTNGTHVQIGLSSKDMARPMSEVLVRAKGFTAHEVEHINSTPFDAYFAFVNNVEEAFGSQGVHRSLGFEMGRFLINSLEDGRIEQISIARYGDVVKRPLQLIRGEWWVENKVSGKNELRDVLFSITTLATTGRLPNEFEKYLKPELVSMIQSTEQSILNYVSSRNFSVALASAWEVVDALAEWMLPHLLVESDSIEELEEMMKELNESFSEISEGFGENDGEPESGDSNGQPQDGSQSQSGTESQGGSQSQGGEKSQGDTQSQSGGQSQDGEKSQDGEESQGGTQSQSGSQSQDGDSSESSRGGAKSQAGNAQDESNSKPENWIPGDIASEQELKKFLKKLLAEAEKENHSLANEVESAIQAELDAERGSGVDDAAVRRVNAELEKAGFCAPKYNLIKNQYTTTVKASPDVIQEGKRLGKIFKALLAVNTDDHYNQKSGRLDMRKLSRLAVNQVDVFKKKGAKSKGGYAIYILIDGSGSMGREKYNQAMRAASVLEQSLLGLAELKIVQFDSGYSINHYLIRDFGDSKLRVPTFAVNNSSGNSNMDGFSIRIATEELLNGSNAEHKLLFVLSDGYPAGPDGYHGARAEEDVRQATRNARRAGIEVFNIMFGSESERTSMLPTFKHMYEKNLVSCDPKDIGNKLGRLVTDVLKRR